MALKAGIVGLPNIGKSTLFNAITNSQAEAANYPFATIEPNSGIVELNDERLVTLAKMVNTSKVVPATFEFIDIAGLVAGASKGEGLGNKFLANIREVDAIIHVVRCFEDSSITHVSGSVDPIRDIEIINTELILADLQTVDNVISRNYKKAVNSNDKDLIFAMEVAKKLKDTLEIEQFINTLELDEKEMFVIKQWNLLTAKPTIYVGNVDDSFVAKPEDSTVFQKLEKYAKENNASVLGISAKIEGELAQLADEDKELFLDDLKIRETGLSRLTRKAFDLLNLATYFTAGVKEAKAWTFNKGMKAPQCAGIIHTDFERGFIKAGVISYEDYVANNGEQGAKQAGKYRLEGKEYVMKDGDVVEFKFNV